jgi:hypothetical protein
MPDSIGNLRILIAERIKDSRKRCDAACKTMQTFNHLINEGRETIVRSRVRLVEAKDLRLFAAPARPLP